MSYITNIILCILFVCVGFAPPSRAALNNPTKEAGIVAHKALYDISLSSKKSNSNISNISGKMFYEFKSSCDAWISNNRFDMLYEYPQGHAVRMTSDLSMHESFDGKEFNFTVQRKRDGDLFEEIRGSASPIAAKYSKPKGLIFELPQGTLFPMAHTLSVLKKIKGGEKFYNATIFDGSDAEGAVDINSLIISEAAPLSVKSDDVEQALIDSKAWNIRLAFFPLNDFEATSDYEMSIIFHENGVISNMGVDYGDFSVTHKLIALKPLDDGCLNDINE